MRLGDLDALKDELLRLGFFPAIVKAAIERMPNIDAKPVVHGQWKIDQRWCYECSVCKKGYVGMPKTNYCPNCGAQMDGVDDDG